MGSVRSGGIALTLVVFSNHPAVAAYDPVAPEGSLALSQIVCPLPFIDMLA